MALDKEVTPCRPTWVLSRISLGTYDEDDKLPFLTGFFSLIFFTQFKKTIVKHLVLQDGGGGQPWTACVITIALLPEKSTQTATSLPAPHPVDMFLLPR